jgi:hypothetical protein
VCVNATRDVRAFLCVPISVAAVNVQIRVLKDLICAGSALLLGVTYVLAQQVGAVVKRVANCKLA